MEKMKKLTTRKLILILAAIFIASGCVLGGMIFAKNHVKRVSTDEEFTYVNPDETKAETDEGFTIDGVLDEEQYQNNNWLYLHNTDDKADVDVSMTSYFGEKGMYIVYDVTERNPVYVNLDRASTVNSCIEMYLAPNSVTSKQNSYFFEIDLLPTGDMSFKKTDGKGAFIDVTTSNDIMAYLGATTKGGEVNTKECTGYCLELFLPWEYTEQFGIDAKEMKDSYIYVTPAHITSFNYEGTNSQEDRYWYFFGDQHGASMDLVYQYFRFNEKGVIGTTSANVVEGEHYSIAGDPAVIPGMKTTYTITPEEGYAINSVLVNGKEHIQNVSYSEEGDVLLTVRGKKEGLEIKATAETVTDGNKTLSGYVEIDGGNLSGVSVSYKGSNGKKPIEIDSNGKFVLTDLKQGYYKIIVEKEGYDKLERGIYLNRDITAELELSAFIVTSGKVWGVDYQEDGILHRFGGTGVILSRASYNKFSIAINMKFDEELTKEYDHTYFTQQRQGIQIKFSNDKYWNVDILYENGGFKVQYAKIMGDKSIYDTWKGVYILSDKESALYTGEEGLTLEVRRDGKYGNVYLNDKLIAVEEFDDEFEKCTAQVGFEAWVANRVVEECEYELKADVKNIAKYTLFNASAGWDISGQFDGYISLPKGGSSRINFAHKYVNMDLTLKVRDYPNDTDAEGKHARTDVLFVFENGAHQSFGITTYKEGTVAIQSVGENDGKQIYDGFKDWGGHLTEEEKALYRGDGIDFRIVRNGTKIYLYVGDRQLKNIADLTNKNSGVTADMPATVYIRHYDDAGVEVIIPFKLKTELDTVTINSVEGANGKVIAARNDYLVGDQVTLSGQGKEGYYCISMKVNGNPVQMNYDGTYTFKATEKTYTVEGEFANQVFVYNSKWNLLKQNEGVVSLPNGGDGGMLQFYKQYTNIDLKLTARDYADEKDTKARTDVLFIFENGRHLSFGLTTYSSGIVAIQSLNKAGADDGQQIYKKFTDWGGHLTDEEKAQYQEEGVDFRIVRNETNIYLYIGDRQLKKVADLTSNNSGVTADMPATVYIRHYDDTGVEVIIPFELKTELDTVTIESVEGEKGKIVAARNDYLVGDEVTLSGEGKEGYYCTSMKVNGEEVSMNYDGTYTFTATEKTYTVEGEFAEQIFVYDDKWNLLEQNNGVITVPNGGNRRVQFYKQYANIDLTLRGYDNPVVSTFGRIDVLFNFENGKHISFGFQKRSDGSGTIAIQSQNNDGADNDGTIYTKWYDWGALNSAETAQYLGDGIDFRIVRDGTNVYLYLGTRQVNVVDLTNNDSGVTADMKATIYIRHYEDTGVEYVLPFKMQEVIPQGIFTIAELAEITATQKVSTEQTTAGVKVTYNDPAYKWARVGVQDKYKIDENGVHIEITDIEYASGDYAFSMYFGNDRSTFFDRRGYALIYENNGKFSIVATKGSGTPQASPKVIDGVQLDPLTGKLSIDIKLVGDNYVIVVNGNSYTIPTKYTESSYQLWTPDELAFSFAFVNTSHAADLFPGATYTIKSIKYNVGGVTFDSSSKTMKVDQKIKLTANVYPERVTNKAVTWMSSDKSIATVDKNGNVIAIAEGTVLITATSVEDTTKKAICEVKVLPDGIFTLAELAEITATQKVSTEQTTAGVKVTYNNPAYKWARVGVQDKYKIDENGVHIEITDIAYASGDYAFSMYFGNDRSTFFDRRGYALIYENNGKFSIVATKGSGTPQASPKVVDKVQLDPLIGKLSIDIKLVGDNYVIVVNGNSYTIPTKYTESSYQLWTPNELAFSFAFVNTSHAADLFPGATYTIKSITYNVAEDLYGSKAVSAVGRTGDVPFVIKSILAMSKED